MLKIPAAIIRYLFFCVRCDCDQVEDMQSDHPNADSNDSQPAHVDASSQLLSRPVAEAADSPVCPVDSALSSNCPVHGSIEPQNDRQIVMTMIVDDKSKKATSEEVDMETGSVGVQSGHHHHHVTRSLVLILALSLHRIFEGMSIGLQQTVANVVSLFGAVMCHEMVIGFSLGLQFVRSGFALRRLLIMSLVCSLIMPLGVLIGVVMTEIESTDSNVDIANGILQAIAMGTFIYVTFFEILQEEVDSDDTSLAKIVFIAAGFALMALLNLVPEGDMGYSSSRYLNTSTAAP